MKKNPGDVNIGVFRDVFGYPLYPGDKVAYINRGYGGTNLQIGNILRFNPKTVTIETTGGYTKIAAPDDVVKFIAAGAGVFV